MTEEELDKLLAIKVRQLGKIIHAEEAIKREIALIYSQLDQIYRGRNHGQKGNNTNSKA